MSKMFLQKLRKSSKASSLLKSGNQTLRDWLSNLSHWSWSHKVGTFESRTLAGHGPAGIRWGIGVCIGVLPVQLYLGPAGAWCDSSMSSDIWRSDVYPFAVSNATLGSVISHLWICHQNSKILGSRCGKIQTPLHIWMIWMISAAGPACEFSQLRWHSTASSFAKDKLRWQKHQKLPS